MEVEPNLFNYYTNHNDMNGSAKKERTVFLNLKNTKAIRSKDYKNENQLVDHVVKYVKEFTVDFLHDKYIEHKKHKQIRKVIDYKKFGGLAHKVKEVDLWVSGEKFNHIIEFKNPSDVRTNLKAIGQVLDYGRLFKETDKDNKLYILSSVYDLDTARTIKHYELPIRYFYMDKFKILEYLGEYVG